MEEETPWTSGLMARIRQERPVLLAALVIGLVAGLLGFTTVAGASIAIAKTLAGLFLLLFLVFLVLGLGAMRRITR